MMSHHMSGQGSKKMGTHSSVDSSLSVMSTGANTSLGTVSTPASSVNHAHAASSTPVDQSPSTYFSQSRRSSVSSNGWSVYDPEEGVDYSEENSAFFEPLPQQSTSDGPLPVPPMMVPGNSSFMTHQPLNRVMPPPAEGRQREPSNESYASTDSSAFGHAVPFTTLALNTISPQYQPPPQAPQKLPPRSHVIRNRRGTSIKTPLPESVRHALAAASNPPVTFSAAATHAVLQNFALQIKQARGNVQEKTRGAFTTAWLKHSYVLSIGGTVSRQAMYSSYTKSCARFDVRPINSASFGKAVRSAFPDIKTRRLGVRGASRYHFVGIRPSNEEEARTLDAVLQELKEEDEIKKKMLAESNDMKRSSTYFSASDSFSDDEVSKDDEHEPQQPGPRDKPLPPRPGSLSGQGGRKSDRPPLSIMIPGYDAVAAGEKTVQAATTMFPQNPVPSGAGAFHFDLNTAIPSKNVRSETLFDGFPTVDEVSRCCTLSGFNPSAITQFWVTYIDYSSSIWDAFLHGDLAVLEGVVQKYWTEMDSSHNSLLLPRTAAPTTPSAMQNAMLHGHENALVSFVLDADAALYNHITSYLHTQLVHSLLDSEHKTTLAPETYQYLTQFAIQIESIHLRVLAALKQSPHNGYLYTSKVEISARLSHIVKRHLGLCQLADGLTSVIANDATTHVIADMAALWTETIDFNAIENHCALVNQSEKRLLDSFFQRARAVLVDSSSGDTSTFVPKLIVFLQQITLFVLSLDDKTNDRTDTDIFNNDAILSHIEPAKATLSSGTQARHRLLCLSYTISQIMRDLTLRSSPLFGSFQIVSSFVEEFSAFHVLRHTALPVSDHHSAPTRPPHTMATPLYQHPPGANPTFSPYRGLATPSAINTAFLSPTGISLHQQQNTFADLDRTAPVKMEPSEGLPAASTPSRAGHARTISLDHMDIERLGALNFSSDYEYIPGNEN